MQESQTKPSRHAKAARWVIFWVITALLFNAGVWYFLGRQKALEFFTGYLIEYSLSVDNLFVFIMIFTYFGVGDRQQHKALNWGIMGAIVFRMVFVLFGVTLIHYFHQVIYAFGLLLLYSAYRMFRHKEKKIQPDKIPLVRWSRKIFPVLVCCAHNSRRSDPAVSGGCFQSKLRLELNVTS